MPMLPKFVRDLRYRIFYGLLLSRKFRMETLGDQSYGLQWTICPDGLGSKSIVYSGGVGDDISFEHELVRKFGCNIVLMDPSPTGLKTMERPENKVPQFQFMPVALAGRSGKIKMSPPPEGGISWSAHAGQATVLEVDSYDLETLMRKHGHDHIDLVKLDIEGCEYEVIDHILEQRLNVRQICADFDYGFVASVRRSQAIRAMMKLVARGYKLICQDGANHTFIRG